MRCELVKVSIVSSYQSKNIINDFFLRFGYLKTSKTDIGFCFVGCSFSGTSVAEGVMRNFIFSSSRSFLFALAAINIIFFASSILFFEISHLGDSGINLKLFYTIIILFFAMSGCYNLPPITQENHTWYC